MITTFYDRHQDNYVILEQYHYNTIITQRETLNYATKTWIDIKVKFK